MLPLPIRTALGQLEADLERAYDDIAAGADILLDHIPARIEAICAIGLTLEGEARENLANRLDNIHGILDDIGDIIRNR